MSYTIEMNHKDAYYEGIELASSIHDYLLQGYTVVVDNDNMSENQLETLFVTIRENLVGLVKQGNLSQGQIKEALANLVTKTTVNNKDMPPVTPIVNVRMHTYASIEVC